MRQRCENPNQKTYAFYGGRGIRVCRRWLKFQNFLSDMGERPAGRYSLGRIDHDNDYRPGNVKWQLLSENIREMRRRVTWASRL
jgi:hypothetical protein